MRETSWTKAASIVSPGSTVPPGNVHRHRSQVTTTARPAAVNQMPGAWIARSDHLGVRLAYSRRLAGKG